jgi:hypothetical protein
MIGLQGRYTLGVIPAKAGTCVCDLAAGAKTEVPAFAGMTPWVGGNCA